MSTPGWYPDPGGAPGRFRFWDGTHWAAGTVANPYTAPIPAAPPRPAPSRADRGWLIAVAVLAAVTLIVVVVIVVVAQRPSPIATPSSGPVASSSVPGAISSPSPSVPSPSTSVAPVTPSPATVSASAAPAVTPSPRPSQPGLNCPVTSGTGTTPQPNGRLQAGTLQIRALTGWRPYTPTGQSYDFDRHGQTTPATNSSPLTTARAGLWVARLAKQDGFTDPQTATNLIMKCLMAGINAQPQLQIQRVQTIDATSQLGGRAAWHRQTRISWATPDATTGSGEQIDVITVDLGGGYLGEYVSFCSLDATDLQQQLDNNLSTLTVVS